MKPIRIHRFVELVWNPKTKQYDGISKDNYWYAGPVSQLGGVPTQDAGDWAFYNDGTESGAVIIGTKNTTQDLDVDTIYHVRFVLGETAGNKWNNPSLKLKVSRNSGAYQDVNAASTVVQSAGSGSGLTDGSDTTQRLALLGGTAFVAFQGQDDVNGAVADTIDPKNQSFEVVFAITIVSGDVADNDTLDFKITTDADVELNGTWTQGFAAATVNKAAANVTGTLDYTELNDTLTAAAEQIHTGTLNETEANDTTTTVAAQVHAGTSDTTEANDTISGTGNLLYTSTLDYQNEDDSITADGNLLYTSVLDETEENDTLTGVGEVISNDRTGTVDVTEQNDIIVAAGSLIYTSTLDITELDDTVIAAGNVEVSVIQGTLDYTELPDTSIAAGNLLYTSVLDEIELDDSIVASGNLLYTSILDEIELPDTIVANGNLLYTSSLIEIEDNDTLVGVGNVPTTGLTSTLDYLEENDTVIAASLIRVSGLLDYAEDEDDLTAKGRIPVTGTITATEQNDTSFGLIVLQLEVTLDASNLIIPIPDPVDDPEDLQRVLENNFTVIQDLFANTNKPNWHIVNQIGEPLFESGWDNYGFNFNVCAYRFDNFGRLQIRGVIQSANVPISTIFVLPEDYRPNSDYIFNAVGNDGVNDTACRVHVYSTGEVDFVEQSVINGVSEFLSLDGILIDTD